MSYVTEKKERNFLYNTLAILLKAVEGERTIVDLRNEASINGVVYQADGFMNILMKDSIFTDPRGDTYKYEIFFVQSRNIRYVHIPSHIRIVPAIKEQLRLLSRPQNVKQSKLTLKSKRVRDRQNEGLEAVQSILEKKKSQSEASGSGS